MKVGEPISFRPDLTVDVSGIAIDENGVISFKRGNSLAINRDGGIEPYTFASGVFDSGNPLFGLKVESDFTVDVFQTIWLGDLVIETVEINVVNEIAANTANAKIGTIPRDHVYYGNYGTVQSFKLGGTKFKAFDGSIVLGDSLTISTGDTALTAGTEIIVQFIFKCNMGYFA